MKKPAVLSPTLHVLVDRSLSLYAAHPLHKDETVAMFLSLDDAKRLRDHLNKELPQ